MEIFSIRARAFFGLVRELKWGSGSEFLAGKWVETFAGKWVHLVGECITWQAWLTTDEADWGKWFHHPITFPLARTALKMAISIQDSAVNRYCPQNNSKGSGP